VETKKGRKFKEKEGQADLQILQKNLKGGHVVGSSAAFEGRESRKELASSVGKGVLKKIRVFLVMREGDQKKKEH